MSAELYINIYYTVLLLVSLYTALHYNYKDKHADLYTGLFVLVWAFLHITFRPLHPLFGDTRQYARQLHWASLGITTHNTKDWGFELLTEACKNFDVTFYFGVICVIYIGTVFFALRKCIPNNYGVAFLVFVGSFSFWGYGINGLRNGIATSVVIFAILYTEKMWQKILMLIIASSFHMSVLLPIVAYATTFFIRNTKVYYYIWGSFLFLSLLGRATVGGFVESLGLFDVDERMADYMMADVKDTGAQFAHIGYRWDFLLYSIVPIALSFYYRTKMKFKDATYTTLLNIYLMCNAFWLLTVYVPYNNRFAYLSWFLYPIVLVYPIIKAPSSDTIRNQHIRVAVFLNFAFTYLMYLK